MQERATSQGIDVAFDAELGNEPDPVWREDLDQLIFRGSRFIEEAVFFHHKTRTLILADLIENFEPANRRRLRVAYAARGVGESGREDAGRP